MLELNKEYTYQQICDALGWEKHAGNSKVAQIKEIESCYEFYHPINKKTHKEKKSYIFTNKIKDPTVPSKHNSGGANNIKSIRYMIDLIQCSGLPDESRYISGVSAHSFAYWQSDFYHVLNKNVVVATYNQSDVTDFCVVHGVTREKLFCEYVALAKIEFKNMFRKALSYLQKKGLVEYEEAYYFQYGLGARSNGKVFTPLLDEIVKENETAICNEFNKKYKFSSKISGRQILFFIYRDDDLLQQYNIARISMLMRNQEALSILNRELANQTNDFLYDTGSICDERPIISYNRAVAITALTEKDGDTSYLAKEVSNQIRKRVRQQLFKKSFIDEDTGKKIHIYTSDDACRDIVVIEKLLFTHYDIEFSDETCLDLLAIDTVYDDSDLPF